MTIFIKHNATTSNLPLPNRIPTHFWRPSVQPSKLAMRSICITLSHKISGTINSANLAKQILDTDKVSLVDSLQSGFGQAALAIKAKEMANQGSNRGDIVEKLEQQRMQSKVFFVVESLRHLYEGGRLNGAEALIGSVIQIKPIIWFDESGLMTALESSHLKLPNSVL